MRDEHMRPDETSLLERLHRAGADVTVYEARYRQMSQIWGWLKIYHYHSLPYLGGIDIHYPLVI